MNIDLSQADIANLLAALNAVEVAGKERMLLVLRLMQKLEAAAAPEASE